MELRQLRYFVAVAEELHFGRAAIRLRISQPGLSQQIKAMEETVGAPLLVRDRRRVELTRAGKSLLETAREVLGLSDRAVAEARAAARGKSAVLRVGTRALGNHRVIGELFDVFNARFPSVELDIRPGLVPQLLKRLTRREIDVAAVAAPLDASSDLEYMPVASLEPLLAFPAEHPVAARGFVERSELCEETFFDWPRSFNPALADHRRILLFGEREHDRLVEVSDLTEITRLLRVSAGEGFTVTEVPELAGLNVGGVAFCRFVEPVPRLEYGVAWRRNETSNLVLSFVELARELSVPS